MHEIPVFQDEQVLTAEELNALARLPSEGVRRLAQLLDIETGLFCLPDDEPGRTNLLRGNALLSARILLPDGRFLVEDRIELPTGGVHSAKGRLLLADGEASLMMIGADASTWTAAKQLAESLESLEEVVLSTTELDRLAPALILVLSRARRNLKRGRSLVRDLLDALDDAENLVAAAGRLLDLRDLRVEAPEDRRITALCAYLRRWQQAAAEMGHWIRKSSRFLPLQATHTWPGEGPFTRYVYDLRGCSMIRIVCTQHNKLVYGLSNDEQGAGTYEDLGTARDIPARDLRFLHVKVLKNEEFAVLAS